MKKIISIVLLMMVIINVKAQQKEELISPNWTLKDVYGVEHTLYDYLDKGMSVVINLSSVAYNEYDGQSWIYLTDGNLDRLYRSYGPGYFGSGEIMVIIMEADPATTLADIYGTGSNTFGNWTTTTDCPIIQNDTITNIYPLLISNTPYPTNYVICPNRTMVQVGWTNETGLLNEIENCTANNYQNNATAAKLMEPYGVGSYGALSFFPKVEVANNGMDSLVTLDITTKIDGVVYSTKQWTGQINTYYAEQITLDPVANLSDGDHLLEVTLSNPNGSTDEMLEDNVLSAAFNTNAALSDFSLFVSTDMYPDETSWEILKENEVILSSKKYTEARSTSKENIALTEGEEYTFVLYDAYADGMFAERMGGITLMSNYGVEIFSVKGDAFTDEIRIPFMATRIEASNAILSSVKVYPNPTQDILMIEAAGAVEVSILDITGKVLLGNRIIDRFESIDIAKFAKGVYFLRTENKGKTSIIKIIKA